MRRWIRRAIKGLLWTLLVLLVLVIVTVLIAGTDTGREKIRQTVLEQTKAVIPGLQIKRIGGNLTSSLTLEGLVLRDRFGDEAIRLERLVLRYSLLSLARKRVVVEAIELHRPQVTIKPARSGKLNLAELVIPSKEEPEPEPAGALDWTVQLQRLLLRDGALTVVDEAGKTTRVRGLELLAAARLAPPPKQNAEALPRSSLELRRFRAGVTLPDGKKINFGLGVKAAINEEVSTRVDLLTSLDQREVRLRLELSGPLSKLKIGTQLELPGSGAVSLEGWAGLRGDGKPHYDLQARLSNVNPQSLLPTLPAASINLGAKVSGEGVPMSKGAKSRFRVAVSPTKLAGYAVDALDLSGTLEAQAWRIDKLSLRAAGSRLAIDGSGDLQRVDAQVQVRAPRLGKLPLPRGTPRLAGSLRLDLGVKGRFAGQNPALDVSTSLRGRHLAVDALRVGGVDLDLELRDLLPDKAGDLDALLGALRVDKLVVAVREVSSATATKTERLVDEADISLRGQRKHLTVSVTASGPVMKADVGVRASIGKRQATADLEKLQLDAQGIKVKLRNRPRLTYGFNGRIALSPMKISALGGELSLGALVQQRGFPRLETKLAFARLKIPKRPGPRLSGKLGVRFDRRQLAADLHLRAGASQPLTLQARIPARGGWPAGPVPRLDAKRPFSVSVRAPRLVLSQLAMLAGRKPGGRGPQGRRGVGNSSGQAAVPVSGLLSISADLGGSLGEPSASLKLGLRDFGYQPHLKKLDGAVTVDAAPSETRVVVKTRLAGRKAFDVDLSAPVPLPRLDHRGRFRFEKPAVASVPLRLKIDGTGLDLAQLHAAVPALQKLKGQLVLSLRTEGQHTIPRSRIKAQIGVRNAAFDVRQIGELVVGATVALSPDAARADLVVRENRQPLLNISANAPLSVRDLLAGRSIAFDRLPLKVNVQIPRYPLARLRRMDPLLERTGGTLGGRFVVNGTLAAPSAGGKLRLQQAILDGVALGDLRASGRFDGSGVDGKIHFAQRAGGTLSAQAKLQLAKKSLEANVKATGLDLKVLRPLVPAVRQSAGRLDIALTARGKLAKPRLRGSLKLSGGELRLSGLPLLSDLGVDVALSPSEVKLRKLHLRSGGTFDATGRVSLVDLKPRKFSLDGSADSLRFTVGGIRDARYNGPLQVSGALGDNSLRATVLINGSRLRLPHIAGGRNLHPTEPPKDVVFVGANKPGAATGAQRVPPTAPMALVASVRTTPLFVNSKEAKVAVVTNLKIRTDAKGRPRITGRVRLRRHGEIKILKYRYKINRAVVNFSGGVEPNPVLDVSLSRDAQDAKIFINLSGSASSPKLDLLSEPPIYDRAQILSLILTGRATVVDSGAETDRTMAVAGAVAGLMLGGLTDWLAPQVGVDVFNPIALDTEKDESGETRIKPKSEVGKFITDRLYIGYRRIWGADAEENQNEGQLEYRITSRWLLMGAFGDAGIGGADLFWIYRY